MTPVQGFLIDLDGVLYIGDKPIKGAVDAVAWLAESGFPYLFLTNLTRYNHEHVHERLLEMGFKTAIDQLFTAPLAAAEWLREQKAKKIFLVAGADLGPDFHDFEITDQEPDYVVVGDLGERFDYGILNKAFQMLVEGAELLALQKNRFWRKNGEIIMDAGGFVSALEFASGKTATLIGKPAEEFFELAAKKLELDKESVAMVGDDLEVDIVGAQEAGLRGILVKTGVYKESLFRKSDVSPDLILDSIADLPRVVGG